MMRRLKWDWTEGRSPMAQETRTVNNALRAAVVGAVVLFGGAAMADTDMEARAQEAEHRAEGWGCTPLPDYLFSPAERFDYAEDCSKRALKELTQEMEQMAAEYGCEPRPDIEDLHERFDRARDCFNRGRDRELRKISPPSDDPIDTERERWDYRANQFQGKTR